MDASVLINFCATTRVSDVLTLIPARILVPSIVLSELERGHSNGHQSFTIIKSFIAQNTIEVIDMDESSEQAYLRLITGSADGSLGDGEAATIACSLHRGGFIALDDAKARETCKNVFPQIKQVSTMDLLVELYEKKQIDYDYLAKAIYDALQFSRMHVLDQYYDFIEKILTPDQRSNCSCLPSCLRI